MAKFEVGDRVRAASPIAPLMEIVEVLGACDYPHDCSGQVRMKPVCAEQVSFDDCTDHVDDFERVA